MHVEYYIVDLLYRHNCIVMPELGAFLANTQTSELSRSSNTVSPPVKILSFNEQLSKNDGLLVSHIAKAKKLPYDDILQEVIATSHAWKKTLQQGEKLLLDGIGSLWMSNEHRILFSPEHRNNFLPDSFGLSPISAIPIKREVIKQEVEALEERIPFIITPEKREATSFRAWYRYAAVFLLMVSMGASAYLGYSKFDDNQAALVENDVQEEVSKRIQEATFFDGVPLELPPLNIKVKKKETYTGPKHYIIAGAFRIKQNADRKVALLSEQGYHAEYLGTNRYGLHQVAYAGFTDKREAINFLRKIKRTVSTDAWMLSQK